MLAKPFSKALKSRKVSAAMQPAVGQRTSICSMRQPCTLPRGVRKSVTACSASSRKGPAATAQAPVAETPSASDSERPNSSSSSSSSLAAPSSATSSASSVLACTLLVAGAAIGAGMLALPRVTAPAGYGASAVALLGACGYSTLTGLLVAEVCINMLTARRQAESDGTSPSSSTSTNFSLTSVALATLGGFGTPLVVLPYFFLHYSLLVAYIAKASELIGGWTGLPLVPATLLFTASFGSACYFLPTKQVDTFNSTMMLVLIASFLGLFGLAASDVEPANLVQANWSELPPALPVISLAFVFQNIVPVIVQRLDCDRGKVRRSIFGGMAISLTMFLAWDGAILGSATATATDDPLTALQAASPLAAPLINTFSFLAVATGFVCFVLSLSDFIADALRSGGRPESEKDIEKQDTASVASRPLLYLATLLPPTALALLNPSIFFSALEYAGSYGVMTLFGVGPAVMAWRQRDDKSMQQPGTNVQMVPGGKPVLLALAATATAIIVNQGQNHISQLTDFLGASSTF